jgi:predicted AlkP superfamily pyrophosphatase or phosphodiesterase
VKALWRLSALGLSLCLLTGVASSAGSTRRGKVRHVLLISVDGLHGTDASRWMTAHPDSALAELAAHGVTYSDAHTPTPSDSFPGLVALVTGGSPKSTGVYYDDSYEWRPRSCVPST